MKRQDNNLCQRCNGPVCITRKGDKKCKVCGNVVKKYSEGMECPRCSQPGYLPGVKFHWSGNAQKQCGVCGKDVTKAKVPPAFRYLQEHSPVTDDRLMTNKGKPVEIQQIQLPYAYEKDGFMYEIVGWHVPKRLLVNMAESGNTIILSIKNTKSLLKHLRLVPDNIPGHSNKPHKRIEYMTPSEWKVWERLRQQWDEMEEAADSVLSGWKDHIRYLEEEYSQYDEGTEELQELVRKLPRMMRYIKTGYFMPLEMEDDNLDYYDDNHGDYEDWRPPQVYHEPLYKRGRTVVEVHIEDISDGKL